MRPVSNTYFNNAVSMNDAHFILINIEYFRSLFFKFYILNIFKEISDISFYKNKSSLNMLIVSKVFIFKLVNYIQFA